MQINLPEGWAPYAVAGDASGDLWVTVLDPPGLARVVLGDGEPVIRHEPAAGRPMLLSIGPDRTVWYTRAGDHLVRRNPGGAHVEIAVPSGAAPYGIAATAGGGAWFTAPGVNQIGHVSSGGAVTMFDIPVPEARAAMLTVDAGGTPWAALNAVGALARVVAGAVEIVGLPAAKAPVGVAASSAGVPPAVWYADIAAGTVGRVDPSGAVEQFAFADPACRPHAVAPDPDGGCWVTLWGSGELGRITADGKVATQPLPGREPHGLWISARYVWVAMESGSLVAVER